MSLKEEWNKGVSTVMAAILMLAIVVALVAVAYMYINSSTPELSHEISALITINYSNGEITISMNSGDPIKEAFKNGSWYNLEVKINGALVDTSNVTCSTGDDFYAGSEITINQLLQPGDTVTVIYTPANQLLRTYTYS
ncbi:MAG TPA: type IV pilin [Thermoplasmatales archaeon]|nr:type IV pilin [Thermoplasmatales archaeon]